MKTRVSSSPKVRKPRVAKKHPSHEEIALRAYHIYLERHGAPGNPLEDWARAERELVEKPKKARRRATVTSIAA
jgi:hypothetical protein